MKIKYRFMEAGLTQDMLAEEVKKRMKADALDMVCDRCCVSLTLAKQGRGSALSPKEQIVWKYLVDIAEGMEHGKEGTEDD